MEGLIIAGTNNTFTVECDDELTRNCTIKGKVLKSDKQFYNPIAPGDHVQVEPDPLNDSKGQVLSVLPRKNTFLRWNVKAAVRSYLPVILIILSLYVHQMNHHFVRVL